ncbi:cell division protein SepF [Mesoplasma photuris]|uniref:cell division protein SepF n=1 Tax=Mesoplasma photuris TaxID=217731 RepID=UPI0004E23DF8|nr:cell division protein SepF [Mesoplasma photuris]
MKLWDKLKAPLISNDTIEKEEVEIDYTEIVEESEDYKTFYETIRTAPSNSDRVYSPTTYNEIQTLSDDLIKNGQIILNLNKANLEESKKILQFLSGVIYVLGGSYKKMDKNIYLFKTKK